MKQKTYLADPCGASSLSFWKTETVMIPAGWRIVKDEAYRNDPAVYQNSTDEPYFKLIHRLKRLDAPVLPEGFILTEIGVKDFARHIAECYEEGGISEEDLEDYRRHPAYDPSLWVAVADQRTGRTVATGIAELDARIGEGILEWIQVSPACREKGLGTFVVNELLSRMKDKAGFVTVSGKVNNKTNPLALYERCGFAEKVIWHIVTEQK
ncbi:MAG: GNAT family N-acetyltransferase [Clostridia bacterium]|nr:GNAT family N-acetyltransferase [Clostridia bacterium]